MEILILILFFFDFAFLNLVAICYMVSMVKFNKLKNDLGGIKDVDLSSFGIK